MKVDTDDMRKVLFVTPELAPFSKVGGLGEVASGLTRALRELDCDVRIVTPLHESMRDRLPATRVAARDVAFDFGGARHGFNLLAIDESPERVPVILVEAPDFFELGDGVYGRERGPSGLGDLRWLYFSALIRTACTRLGFEPDLLHVHDWHSALVPALYRSDHFFDEEASDTACVLTVHNAAFQGRMSVEDYRRSGLRGDLLSEWYLLQGGEINLLKAGAIFAERVTTVSRRYAEELMSRDQGKGLETVFESRSEHFQGIPNGLDEREWDPTTDDLIPANFDADDLSGKKTCQEELLKSFELDPTTGPVLGVVARLTWQKGIDIILDSLRPLFARRRDLRMVILGQGDRDLELALEDAARKYPGRLGVALRFDPTLAHLIEAGSDLFLMPSRYEPCGLNQMISQRYGTIPVVRRTGGLADTVVPYEEGNLDEATGFVFMRPTAEEFIEITKRALTLFRRSGSWRRLVRNAMAQDWGWDESATEYLKVYEEAVSMRRNRERESELLSHMRLEPSATLPEAQATIPTHYDRDYLRLFARDPRKIWVSWEVQGPLGRPILDELSEQQKWDSRWFIELEDLDRDAKQRFEVEGFAKNWFLDAEPETRYRAALIMSAEGLPETTMVRSEAITTPRDEAVIA